MLHGWSFSFWTESIASLNNLSCRAVWYCNGFTTVFSGKIYLQNHRCTLIVTVRPYSVGFELLYYIIETGSTGNSKLVVETAQWIENFTVDLSGRQWYGRDLLRRYTVCHGTYRQQHRRRRRRCIHRSMVSATTSATASAMVSDCPSRLP